MCGGPKPKPFKPEPLPKAPPPPAPPEPTPDPPSTEASKRRSSSDTIRKKAQGTSSLVIDLSIGGGGTGLNI